MSGVSRWDRRPRKADEPPIQQEVAFLIPPAVSDMIRDRAEHEHVNVGIWLLREVSRRVGLHVPPASPRTPQRGVSPTGATRPSGMRLMKFNAPHEVMLAIDEAAEKERLTRSEWVRKLFCEIVGVTPPEPGKRGPKPRAQRQQPEEPVAESAPAAEPAVQETT